MRRFHTGSIRTKNVRMLCQIDHPLLVAWQKVRHWDPRDLLGEFCPKLLQAAYTPTDTIALRCLHWSSGTLS